MKDNFSALAENDLLRLKSTCFLWLIFAVINFGWLSGLNFHIDNEITAIRVDPLIWLVQGRWGAYLLERYILPKTFVSFFPLAVYGLCGAYAYLLYLGSTGKRPREIGILDYLLFPVFIAYPSITFLYSYSANIAMQGLALVLCAGCSDAFSAFLRLSGRRIGVGYLGLVVIWGCFAISIYQTNLLLLWASLLVPLLSRIYGVSGRGLLSSEGEDVVSTVAADHREPTIELKTVFADLVLSVVLAAFALMLYFLVEFNWLAKLHVQLFYIPRLVDYQAIFRAPLSVVSANLGELIDLLGRDWKAYGVSAFPLGVTVLLSVLVVLFSKLKTSKPGILVLRAVLWGVFISSPVYAGFILKLPAPVRSLVSLPLVVWFLFWIALRCLQRSRSRVQKVALIVLGLSLINLVYISSYRCSSNQLIQEHDRMLATLIAADFARLVPNFSYEDSSRYFLVVCGKNHFDNIYGPSADDNTDASIFEADEVRSLRVIAFLKILGLADFRLLPEASEGAVAPLFAGMPCWPDPGGIKLCGNVVLLKLSAPARSLLSP